MRPETKIILVSLLAGIFSWVIDWLIQFHLIIQLQTDPSASILVSHEAYSAGLLIGTFVLFGMMLARSYAMKSKAENQLTETKKRYEILSDASFEGIVIHDGNKIIDANRSWLEMTGYDLDEVRGIRPYDLVAPEYLEKVRKMVESGNETPYELEIFRKDGSRIWVEVCGKQSEHYGKPVRITSVRDLTFSRRAEEAIRHSEEHYRTLFLDSTDPLFLSKLLPDQIPGPFIDVNHEAIELFGYSGDELLGRTPLDLLAPDATLDIAQVSEKLRTEGRARFEAVGLKKNGERVHMELSARMFMLKGQPAVISSVRDVSDRKSAEEMLRASEDRYRTMMNALPITVFEIDLNGKLSFVNSAGLGVFGVAEADLEKGIDALSFVTLDFRGFAGQDLSAIFTEGVELASEFQMRRGDGSTFPAIVHASPVFENGRTVGVRGIVMDVSSVKEANEALKQALERFETVIENTPLVAIRSYSPDGTIRQWNRASEKLFSIDAVDALGKHVQELMLNAGEQEDFTEVVREICKSKSATEPREWRMVKGSGEERWMYSTMFPMIRNGEVEEIFCMDVDITDRKLMEEEIREKNAVLQAAMAVKTEFLSMVSHELRSPLVPILGYTELMLGGTYGELPDSLHDPVNIVHNRAEALSKLIEDLLTISRLDRSALRIETGNHGLKSLTENIVKSYMEVDQGKPVNISVTGDDVQALVDPLRFRQAIQNLINNAIKYSHESVAIFVKTGLEDDRTYVSVADNGIGISEEHLPYVFERFYQAEFVDTRAHEGTGLGLAICKEIIELMEGTISVESVSGKGSTFTIKLPLAASMDEMSIREFAPDKTSMDASNAVEYTGDPSTRILIIDDDEFTLELLEVGMKANFNVLTACDAVSGLRIARDEIVDIILLDWMMPEMD